MPTRTRSVAALAAAAAFAVPLLVSLGTTVPPIQRVPLGVEERAGGFPAELRGRWSVDLDGTFYLLRIGLRTSDPSRLLEGEEITFEILPHDGPIDLHDAWLAFDGITCTYRQPNGAGLGSDGTLTLSRGIGCAHPDHSPSGAMLLTLRLASAGHAALRTAVRSVADTPPGAVVVSTFGLTAPTGQPLARGTVARVIRDVPAARRLTLLAYVWNESPSGLWIVLVLLGAASAIGAAVCLSSRQATATFLAALALSVAYAVLVPPFQGADEPNHFLTLADSLDLRAAADEAPVWARRARFEELRAVGRPFTPADLGKPGDPWVGVGAPDPMRGAGASALWGLLSPALRHASAPRALLTIRLFHAVLFAAAAGLFVLAVARLTSARRPALLAIPIFFVPTLPYFGMHLSNYAPLVGVYVLFAAGVAVALWDGPESHWSAPLLALGVTLGMALARSAVPLAGLAAGIVAARICLGDSQGRRRPTAMYWSLLTIAAIIGLSLANLGYPEGPERGIIRYDIAHGRVAWLVHHPRWLAVPGAALAAIEIGVSSLTRRLSAPSPARAAIVRVTAYAAAAAIAAAVLAAPWLPHPVSTPLLNLQRVTTLEESTKEFLPALLTWPRFGRPDVLTSTTFWGGFGWLEKLLPDGIVSALAGASGLALAALLAWVGRRRSGRALVWLAFAAAGYVVSAGAYAFTARLIFTDVHGRYLLGLYLSALVIMWSVVARWSDSRIGRPGLVTSIAAAGALALHTWTLTWLLTRYF